MLNLSRQSRSAHHLKQALASRSSKKEAFYHRVASRCALAKWTWEHRMRCNLTKISVTLATRSLVVKALETLTKVKFKVNKSSHPSTQSLIWWTTRATPTSTQRAGVLVVAHSRTCISSTNSSESNSSNRQRHRLWSRTATTSMSRSGTTHTAPSINPG